MKKTIFEFALLICLISACIGCKRFVSSADQKDVSIVELMEEKTEQTYQIMGHRDLCTSAPPMSPLYGGRTVGFIRLKYKNSGWDSDSNAKNAPVANLLANFREVIGLSANVLSSGTSCMIASLAKASDTEPPPCIWMTGISDISMSNTEIQTIKDYLVRGGMILVTSGDPRGLQELTSLAERLFPKLNMFKVAKDEPILSSVPYEFSDGPPSLSNTETGVSCWGIKYNSCLVLLYYPEDLIPAWDLDNSKIADKARERALRFGVNMIHYGHVQWLIKKEGSNLLDDKQPNEIQKAKSQ